jgi:hypothetical protein
MLSSTVKAFISKWAPNGKSVANQLHLVPNVVKLNYDFAVQAGAVGVVNLLDEDGQPFTLPNKAIIKQVWIDILTAFTSTGNNGTIALTANASGDLLAAVDADTLSGIVPGIPTGAAAAMVKCTAARTLKLAIATNAILTGKADVFVEYVQGT